LESQLQEERNVLDIEKKKFELERDKIRVIQEVQAGKIKLNVGGTYFTTSVSTLTREPNSMLARLCTTSGFEPSADDGAYFLDRVPELFKAILFYLRMGRLSPEISKEEFLRVLLEEANYFMMDKLVNIIEELIEPTIQKETDVFVPNPNNILSNNNKTATKTNGQCPWTAVLGRKRLSKGTHQWNIKITAGDHMIGVAPNYIDQNGSHYHTKCGWYLYVKDSTLYSGPPNSFWNQAYSATGQLALGSIVSVKLDMDNKVISFIINGTDYGVAFNNIPIDSELSLCAILNNYNDSIEIL